MTDANLLSILLIAVGLAADCFAVAVGGGITTIKLTPWRVLKVAFSFGVFQALMPVLGWLAGRSIVTLISGYDHWLAFGLLAIVGGRMLWESWHHKDSSAKKADITKGLLLLTLSVATSIDALAVGLSFAFLDVNIALAASVIGAIAFVATIAGFLLGNRLGTLAGRWAEAIGGVVLIGVGLRILLSHIL